MPSVPNMCLTGRPQAGSGPQGHQKQEEGPADHVPGVVPKGSEGDRPNREPLPGRLLVSYTNVTDAVCLRDPGFAAGAGLISYASFP